MQRITMQLFERLHAFFFALFRALPWRRPVTDRVVATAIWTSLATSLGGLAACGGLTACGSLPGGLSEIAKVNPTVSGDPCRNADWFEVGRVDGLNGIPLGTSAYVQRCRAREVLIEEELYLAGWNRGLVDYCSPERGFDAGRSGSEYADVCPEVTEQAFLKRFKIGAQIAQLEKENMAIETELESHLSKLATLSRQMPAEQATTPDATADAANNTPGKQSSILADVTRRLSGRDRQLIEIQQELQVLRDKRARNELTIRELEGVAL
ncbi:MAG: DUF2799 domain-containing protein [Bdellovibrionales bacterium]|jgi:hypothetical protein|nr:DUF2799 domain-containing protein [Bdellovibrionales bacterium]